MNNPLPAPPPFQEQKWGREDSLPNGGFPLWRAGVGYLPTGRVNFLL